MGTFGQTFAKTLGFFTAIITLFFGTFFIISIINNFTDIQYNNYDFLKGAKSSENKIILLELNGPILNQSSIELTFFPSEIIYANEVEKLLLEIEKDPDIRGILISMNSPGGTVSGSNRLYEIFENFKKNNSIPIYIHSNELLASGAVWSASGANKIYASYGALIGNIGVKGPSWFVYNNPISMKYDFFSPEITTLDGIDFYQPTAGDFKDLFNPFRKPSEKEIENIQYTLNSIYDDFLNIIHKNRKINKEFIKNNLGALIFDSNSAKKHNLIDGVSNIDETLEIILKENNISENFQFIKFKNKTKYFKGITNLIFSNSFSNDTLIKKDLCNLANKNILLIGQYNFNICKN